MKTLAALLCAAALVLPAAAAAQEPDHAIHEELRAVLRDVQAAINSGRYDSMLPLLAPDVEITSITQEVMNSREDVARYFRDWFGPAGYMKSMTMKLDADKLTQLSPDKAFGLVRGSGVEHYEAKDGDQFDFKTRWTAVLARSDDGKWRLRAVHIGTNHLDNPVLTKVSRTLIRNGIIASVACLLLGLGFGFVLGRRRGRAA
ncbi:MAG: DUF4440 domain-containing protein [Burkholderiales bacterium]